MSDDRSRLLRLHELPLAEIYERRVGWHWEIFTKHSDGIERPLSPINPRFWRWVTAARLAMSMRSEMHTAAWIALE